MQAGTWSPKAASRQREIREKPTADELKEGEKWPFSEMPQLS